MTVPVMNPKNQVVGRMAARSHDRAPLAPRPPLRGDVGPREEDGHTHWMAWSLAIIGELATCTQSGRSTPYHSGSPATRPGPGDCVPLSAQIDQLSPSSRM